MFKFLLEQLDLVFFVVMAIILVASNNDTQQLGNWWEGYKAIKGGI